MSGRNEGDKTKALSAPVISLLTKCLRPESQFFQWWLLTEWALKIVLKLLFLLNQFEGGCVCRLYEYLPRLMTFSKMERHLAMETNKR
jgi:hypothetical protein